MLHEPYLEDGGLYLPVSQNMLHEDCLGQNRQDHLKKGQNMEDGQEDGDLDLPEGQNMLQDGLEDGDLDQK